METFTDPLSTLTGIVEAVTLKRWATTDTPYYPESDDARLSKFPFNYEINNKVVLWEGDATKLIVDLIVHPTNETLNDKNPLSERIHKVAGPLLKEECRTNLLSCRTGQAKVTKGYELPARYVAHTVGPRYNVKYKTAAESALYMCYRNIMGHAREHHLKSVGLSVVHTTRRGYPPEEGAHIALRTVRRFIEKNFDAFEVIVFVVEPIDESQERFPPESKLEQLAFGCLPPELHLPITAPLWLTPKSSQEKYIQKSIYKRLMPLYFPRNKTEEQYAALFLPQDVGNEDGEPYIADRQIRINEKPVTQRDAEILEDGEARIDLINSFVGRHPFASVAGDNDQVRRAKLHGRSSDEIEVIEQQRRYAKWVKRSRTEDHSEMQKLRFLYQSGVDSVGRPVVVFVARNFPAQAIDLNKAVSYFINVMDPIASRDYVAVYFHTLVSEENSLSLSFLRDMYEMLDIKYRRNLRGLYVVHGSVWDRIITWFFTLFSAASIKEHIKFLSGVQYLNDYISPDQLEIPPFVLEFDLQENGPNYYTPQGAYRPGLF